jgi:hypothetical protein
LYSALLALSPLLATPLLSTYQDDPADLRREVQDYWTDVAESLAENYSVAQTLPADPADLAMRERLWDTRVEGLRCQNEKSLGAVLDLLSSQGKVPLALDPRAESACLDAGVVFDLQLDYPVPVATALDILCEAAGDEVEWTVHKGAALITVAGRGLGQRVFMHMIGDLVTLMDAEELSCFVQEQVEPSSWDWGGGSIEPVGPFLLVVTTREAQLGIERLLGDLRAFQASLEGTPNFEPTEKELQHDALLGRLEAVRVLPRFDGAHIEEIASFLQEVTGVNFLVSNKVREELSEADVTLSLDLEECDVRSLLDLIVELRPQLAWALVGDVVQLQSTGEPRPDRVLALYDVRAIIEPADPRFALRANFESSEDVYEAQLLHSDNLLDLIINTVATETWDQDVANSLRIHRSGVLIVNQSVEVQGQIRAFVGDLVGITDVLRKVQDDHRRDR